MKLCLGERAAQPSRGDLLLNRLGLFAWDLGVPEGVGVYRGGGVRAVHSIAVFETAGKNRESTVLGGRGGPDLMRFVGTKLKKNDD